MTSQETVTNLLDDWYAAMSPNWSPTTARQTKSVIDCHLVPSLGDLQLQTLRTEDIDAFYGELRRRGGRDGQPLSPGTVHRVHVVLHRALAQALRWGWLWVNPASSASPPSCEPAPPESRRGRPAALSGVSRQSRVPHLLVAGCLDKSPATALGAIVMGKRWADDGHVVRPCDAPSL